MERGRKLLQARALHHWIERASINRLILITQFSIFARKCTFFQSGSHIVCIGSQNAVKGATYIHTYICVSVCVRVGGMYVLEVYNIKCIFLS